MYMREPPSPNPTSTYTPDCCNLDDMTRDDSVVKQLLWGHLIILLRERKPWI